MHDSGGAVDTEATLARTHAEPQLAAQRANAFVATLAAFMNTELSAFYFDIRKDTLYCDPPSSVARKAALTAIDIICDAVLKGLAPVLSFTCEEAWQLYRPGAEPSVHLTLFPEGLEAFRDEALAKIRAVSSSGIPYS